MMLIVTTISLAIAAFAGVVAWRVAVEAEERSEARVALLADALHTVPLPPSRRLHVAAAAIAAFLVLGTIGAARFAFLSRPAAADEPRSTPAVAATAARPLELVALGHERDRDRLTIRGVVRNPEGAAALEGVEAVVFLYRANGDLLTSTRAPMTSGWLESGAQSTFAATVLADDVARYRVSFRKGDRVLPHVDRRAHS